MPVIGSVTPDRGPAGTVVSLDGEYFCGRAIDAAIDTCDTTGTVQFGETPSISSVWTDSRIMVEVPTGVRGELDIRVMIGGRRSNDVDFTVD